MLQYAAVCCSMVQCIAVCRNVLLSQKTARSMLQYAAVCCRMLQHPAVRYSVL